VGDSAIEDLAKQSPQGAGRGSLYGRRSQKWTLTAWEPGSG